MSMSQREKEALDRHITGNYGEDQFKGADEDEDMEQPTLKDKIRKFPELYKKYGTTVTMPLIYDAVRELGYVGSKEKEAVDIIYKYATGEFDINTTQRYLVDVKMEVGEPKTQEN